MSHQDEAWRGEMGTAYTQRQTLTLDARKAMFARILLNLDPLPQSVIEFGANVGNNLQAIRELLPACHLTGVELNATAFGVMKKVANLAFHGSILDFPTAGQWEMSMTRGLLIHIQPVELLRAYDVLYKAASRWILIAEYYSPQPRMIPYRGQDNLLWARDFAGEMMDRYPNLRLVDYFFTYHRDPTAPQDDVTAFILEKT